MVNHVKVYYEYFGYGEQDTILCEVCSAPANDIHHIIPRSRFGKKRKGEQDKIENLVALCREHHTQVHQHKIPTEELQAIHLKILTK